MFATPRYDARAFQFLRKRIDVLAILEVRPAFARGRHDAFAGLTGPRRIGGDCVITEPLEAGVDVTLQPLLRPATRIDTFDWRSAAKLQSCQASSASTPCWAAQLPQPRATSQSRSVLSVAATTPRLLASPASSLQPIVARRARYRASLAARWMRSRVGGVNRANSSGSRRP
jgi:hypothetical protein